MSDSTVSAPQNAAEALAYLTRPEHLHDLRQSCYDSYKDFTGFKGRHFLQADMETLTKWWLNYFVWHEESQTWMWTPYAEERAAEC